MVYKKFKLFSGKKKVDQRADSNDGDPQAESSSGNANSTGLEVWAPLDDSTVSKVELV
jgi:hypothetical protein